MPVDLPPIGNICGLSAHGLHILLDPDRIVAITISSIWSFIDREYSSATAAGELFQFGGSVRSRKSSDVYVFSTRDFSTTLLQSRGDVPAPRLAPCSALTLLICGVVTNVVDDQNAPNH